VAGLAALTECWATSRLKDDEFAIATFAMHALFWMLLMNWVEVTRGPLGIPNIPAIQLFGHAFDAPSRFFVLPVALLGASLWVVWRLQRQPFGRLARMVRDDEELAEMYGRDVKQLRRAVWLTAAIMACCAGILHASYQGYVHPTSFSSMESAVLLAIVIIGGPGRLWGPMIGAFVITCVPEALRFVGLPVAQAANIRQIFLGVVLVVVILRAAVTKKRTRIFEKRSA
jgi:branched-chain amino acid transport system permease protein